MRKHLKYWNENILNIFLTSIPEENRENNKGTIFENIVLRMFQKDVNIHIKKRPRKL